MFPKQWRKCGWKPNQHYARPAAFGSLYRRAGIATVLALVAGLVLFLLLAMGLKGSLLHPPLAGDFYQIFPHNLLAWMFGSVFIVAIGLLMSGVIRFWREISPGQPQAGDIARASHDALTLKYLDGGHGKGCNEANDAFTLMRRRFHHFTFYGFMLCFAATVVATGYHYFAGWEGPLPVLQRTGDAGHARRHRTTGRPCGFAMAEPAPLAAARRRAAKTNGSRFYPTVAADQFYRARATGGPGHLVDGHSACYPSRVVMALFLTLPYGKFAHGFYRCAALLKWAIEKRRGKQAAVAGD
ncbi:TcuB: works with TcuA to oxidize tricarballylate to cis-aconitate (plasmid) [Klebsiella aerogenes]|nr:TcuB: works with TcuA to oxidize tricarballylate to cis-aconitate [Klebsiella aerogenes]